MKAGLIHLALVLGLAVRVMGDALPPNDIPLRCVAICGPVVELSADCNNKGMSLQKRKPERRSPEPARQARDLALQEVDGVREREFSVIVAAPTSFPVQEATTTTALDLRPTSTATRIVPVVSQSSSSTKSTLSTSTTAGLSTSTSTVTTYVTFTNTPTTARSMSVDSESATTSSAWSVHDSIQEPQGQLYSQASEEEDCVCLNDSFDVAKVTALCASCVTQAGFPGNNVDVIMDVCNFTALAYSRSEDSVVNNVRVEASWPSSDANRGESLSVRVMAAVAGLVMIVLW